MAAHSAKKISLSCVAWPYITKLLIARETEAKLFLLVLLAALQRASATPKIVLNELRTKIFSPRIRQVELHPTFLRARSSAEARDRKPS